MKAQHNYTTLVRTATWRRAGLAALLTLAALLVGLMLLGRTNGQSPLPTSTSAAPVRHISAAFVSCRMCRDEWAAAQMVQPVRVVSLRHLQATGALVSCRACRDEWLAAQSPSIPTGDVTFEQPNESFRTSGPR
jgi:hypothetical protein